MDRALPSSRNLRAGVLGHLKLNLGSVLTSCGQVPLSFKAFIDFSGRDDNNPRHLGLSSWCSPKGGWTANPSQRWWEHFCVCAQSCPTLCDLMDCSPPGSSVHGIFQARVLQWVTISFSRVSSQPRDWTTSLAYPALAGRFFTTEPPGKPWWKPMGTLQLQLFSSTASIPGILAGGWPERGSASSSLEGDPGGAWAGLILRDRSCVSVWACTHHSGKLRKHQCAPPASHIHLHTSPLASSATPENMCVRLFTHTHTHTAPAPGQMCSRHVDLTRSQQRSAQYTCHSLRPRTAVGCRWDELMDSHRYTLPGGRVYLHIICMCWYSLPISAQSVSKLTCHYCSSKASFSRRLRCLPTHCQKVLGRKAESEHLESQASLPGSRLLPGTANFITPPRERPKETTLYIRCYRVPRTRNPLQHIGNFILLRAQGASLMENLTPAPPRASFSSLRGHTLYYRYYYWSSEWKSLSCVRLFATPWTTQSVEFSRPEYWSG